MKNYNLNPEIWISELLISNLALYHLSYPGSIYGNFYLESNAVQGVVRRPTDDR